MKPWTCLSFIVLSPVHRILMGFRILNYSSLHTFLYSKDTPENPSLTLNLLTIISKTDSFQKKIQNKSKIIVSKEWKTQNILLCWRWFSERTPPLLKVWSIMIYCDWFRLLELDNPSLALNELSDLRSFENIILMENNFRNLKIPNLILNWSLQIRPWGQDGNFKHLNPENLQFGKIVFLNFKKCQQANRTLSNS